MKPFVGKLSYLINNRKIHLYYLIIIAIILFHIPIESIITKTLVIPLFSNIKTSLINDFCFLLIIVYAILYVSPRVKKHILSYQLVSFYLLGSIFYCYYRFFSDVWQFQGFELIPNIKYGDTFLVVSAINLFLFKYSKPELPENSKNSLHLDIPLGTEHIDSLGYSTYAKILSKKIVSSHFEVSYAIGINGKWGLGKTSFINLLKRELKDDVIGIDFNPWNSQTPQAIIIDFFESIQEALSPYHSSIARILNKYSGKLIKINDNTFTQSAQVLIQEFVGNTSLNSLFKEINESLKVINKKIIVYIDDLDRLDKDEILEIIRIIRNTANFYNTFFIVAYDRNYILNALKGHNPYNNEQFLEKIFQLELTLPYFENSVLRYKLVERLCKSLPSNYHNAISECIIGTEMVRPSNFSHWLETMRDVTRLTNTITLNSDLLLGNIDIRDFIVIELLRLKFPAVHNLLFTKTDKVLESKNDGFGGFVYQLSKVADASAPKGDSRIGQFKLSIYLEENHKALSVPKNDIERITTFVESIFPNRIGRYSYQSNNIQSIIYPSKFYRYFAYNLLKGDLSEIEFSVARSKEFEEFVEKISEWVTKGLEVDLRNRFVEIRTYDDKQDFENIIKGIFYLANQTSIKDTASNLIGYEGRDLLNKLSDYNDKTSETLYANHGGKEALKKFITTVLYNEPSPYLFAAELLFMVNDQYEKYSFPLSQDEVKEISLSYFEKYCVEHTHVDQMFFRLYWLTEQTTNTTGYGGDMESRKSIPVEATEIFKRFILTKDFDGYLLMIIEPEQFGKKLFAISKSVPVIFEDWTKFKDVLFEQDEMKWQYLKEFKDFFTEFEKEGFSKYIPFSFAKIPAKKRG